MRLAHVSAVAHPEGNRIDLAWADPDPVPAGYALRIARKVASFPATPEDGAVLTPEPGKTTYRDTGLHGETVYYYGFFPSTSAEVAVADPRNRASAMATAPYGIAGLMYAMLPQIYLRYDGATTLRDGDTLAAMAEADRDRGILRRFLELPGGQLDSLYSLARAALTLHDIDRVDGALLPLLAQWIGWRTDQAAALTTQRNEIRFAPWLYRRTGTASVVQATTSRVTGRPCRIKEYVHNVARTNQPERLNLWSRTRAVDGSWEAEELLSVNFAYGGRATHVATPDGSALLMYHTHRRHGWDIWAKRLDENLSWSPSWPIVDRAGADEHPSAAIAGARVWLFWQASGPAGGNARWRIAFRTRPVDAAAAAPWSDITMFGDPDLECRAPAAVADQAGGLWLFWKQRTADGWQIRYNRHDGTRWELDDPATVPTGPVGGIDEDLAVLNHTAAGVPRLWLFWARRRRDPGTGRDTWTIRYVTKAALVPGAADWSAVADGPAGAPGAHDREPAPIATDTGVELFFSSTRAGGWAALSSRLDTAGGNWSAVESVVGGPFTNRAPVPLRRGDQTVLIYRCNRSLSHARGDGTLDARYGGTTTVDTGAAAKIALRGGFEDFATYTYDSRRGRRPGTTPSARDAVGVDLNPPADADPETVHADAVRLAAVLPEYLPITTRAVILDDATQG